MDEWVSFLSTVEKEIDRLDLRGTDIQFFRGHNDSSWQLVPSLYRTKTDFNNFDELELTLLMDFLFYSGPIYGQKLNSWETLFEMRQAELPTRLLDWTENFASALFFALRGIDWVKNSQEEKKLQPCIWIMDPFQLNKKFYGIAELPFPDDLDFNYDDIIEKEPRIIKKSVKGPIAILPPRTRQRIFAQKSVYTLHVINYEPIEKLYKNCVKKIDVPLNSIDKAKKFLALSGINEYSLFPDLDGLGRYLLDRHVRK